MRIHVWAPAQILAKPKGRWRNSQTVLINSEERSAECKCTHGYSAMPAVLWGCGVLAPDMVIELMISILWASQGIQRFAWATYYHQQAVVIVFSANSKGYTATQGNHHLVSALQWKMGQTQLWAWGWTPYAETSSSTTTLPVYTKK